jgi:hypothetical protein
MTKKQLLEIIRSVIKQELLENKPAVAPTKPGTKPTTPAKPDKQKPRRPLGNPAVKPQPKAKMNEEEVLNKIVARFKSKKK